MVPAAGCPGTMSGCCLTSAAGHRLKSCQGVCSADALEEPFQPEQFGDASGAVSRHVPWPQFLPQCYGAPEEKAQPRATAEGWVPGSIYPVEHLLPRKAKDSKKTGHVTARHQGISAGIKALNVCHQIDWEKGPLYLHFL